MTTRPSPPVPTVSHREAPELARSAYARFATLAEGVTPDDWARPTDCTGWTVRDLVGHVVGAMRAAASVGELISQQREITRRVRRDGGDVTDVMTALQIERTATLPEATLVGECRRLVEPATRGRARTPGALRSRVAFPVPFGGRTERWTLGYLVDVILTRDAWLHCIDLARAVGVEVPPDPAADRRIVADVVAEWGARHGEPFRLELTGLVTGSFGTGTAPAIELDAVELCRILSGRARGDGLLATQVPF